MEESGSRGGEAEGGSLDSLSAWNPCGGAFRPYLGTQSSGRRPPVTRKKTVGFLPSSFLLLRRLH